MSGQTRLVLVPLLFLFIALVSASTNPEFSVTPEKLEFAPSEEIRLEVVSGDYFVDVEITSPIGEKFSCDSVQVKAGKEFCVVKKRSGVVLGEYTVTIKHGDEVLAEASFKIVAEQEEEPATQTSSEPTPNQISIVSLKQSYLPSEEVELEVYSGEVWVDIEVLNPIGEKFSCARVYPKGEFEVCVVAMESGIVLGEYSAQVLENGKLLAQTTFQVQTEEKVPVPKDVGISADKELYEEGEKMSFFVKTPAPTSVELVVYDPLGKEYIVLPKKTSGVDYEAMFFKTKDVLFGDYEVVAITPEGNYSKTLSFAEEQRDLVCADCDITPLLTAEKDAFELAEAPSFEFEYITEEELAENSVSVNFTAPSEQKRFVGKRVQKDELTEAVLTTPDGTPIPVEMRETRTGKLDVEVPVKRGITPGNYKLTVKYTRNGVEYSQEQEFAWGLVSVNSKKSIYRPGETAELLVVVLDAEGHPVSNATIELKITDPQNIVSTYSTDAEIILTSEPGVYAVSHKTTVTGTYGITVNATTVGINTVFDTYFLVKTEYDYDIVRTAQSKIDPTQQDIFDVRVDIETFVGGDTAEIVEFVPSVFNVFAPGASVKRRGDTTEVVWSTQFENSKAFVEYSYSVPHEWPKLYALGPLQVNGFEEARPWYVAVDPAFGAAIGEAHDIDIAILNEDLGMFVLAWCDNNDDSAMYQVWFTNGTSYTRQLISGIGGDSCRIAVDRLNTTAFIVAYTTWSAGDTEWMNVGYDMRTDSIIRASAIIDADMDEYNDVGVCSFNDTWYVTVAADDKDHDATYEIWYLGTTEVQDQLDIDGDAVFAVVDSQLADCAAYNETTFAFVYHDIDPDQIIHSLYSIPNSAVKGISAVDASDTDGGVSVTGTWGNGAYAVVYCDGTDNDVSYSILDGAGGDVSVQQDLDQDITSCGNAAGTMVEVAALNETGGALVAVWDDTTGDDIYIAAANSTDTSIMVPTKVNDSDASDKAVAIAAFNPVHNVSICKHVFDNGTTPIVVAYTGLDGPTPWWNTYYSNGTVWDGTCEAPPPGNTAPSIDSVQVNGSATYRYEDMNVTVNHTDINGDGVTIWINIFHNFTDGDTYHFNNSYDMANWSTLNPTNTTWFFNHGNYSNDTNVTFQVNATDATAFSSYSNESRYVSNNAPSIDWVGVNGTTIRSYQDMNVTVNYTELDGHAVNIWINIYHNFTEFDTYHFNTSYMITNWSTLNPTNATWFYHNGNYSARRNITFQVNATDGNKYSSYENESRYITDTAPYKPNAPTITPDPAYKNNTLQSDAGAGGVDPDGDSVTYWYQWRDSDDTTVLWMKTTQTFDCTAEPKCQKGDTIYLRTLAETEWLNSSLSDPDDQLIKNSNPHIDDIYVNGTVVVPTSYTINAGEDLNVTFNYTDVDGTTVKFNLEVYHNFTFGDPYHLNDSIAIASNWSTSPVPVQNLTWYYHFRNYSGNVNITFRVIADDSEGDGTAYSTPSNASVYVLAPNIAPEVDWVGVNGTFTYGNQDMNVTVNHTDADGDSVTFTVNVYHNYTEFDTYHLNDTYTFANWSTLNPTNTTWFFTYTNAAERNYSNNTNVTFQVKANDGNDDSAFFNESRYVHNQIPITDWVGVNGTTIRSTQDMNVTVNFTELDGDPVTIWINVYHNFTAGDIYHFNDSYAIFNWSTSSPPRVNTTWFYHHKNYSTDRNVTFQVNVSDGGLVATGDFVAYNISRYTDNNAPTTDSVLINGTYTYFNTDTNVTANYSDADGDPVTIWINIFHNYTNGDAYHFNTSYAIANWSTLNPTNATWFYKKENYSHNVNMTFQVNVTDDADFSSYLNNSRYVHSREPLIDAVHVNGTSTKIGQDMNVTVNYTELEGDSVTIWINIYHNFTLGDTYHFNTSYDVSNWSTSPAPVVNTTWFYYRDNYSSDINVTFQVNATDTFNFSVYRNESRYVDPENAPPKYFNFELRPQQAENKTWVGVFVNVTDPEADPQASLNATLQIDFPNATQWKNVTLDQDSGGNGFWDQFMSDFYVAAGTYNLTLFVNDSNDIHNVSGGEDYKFWFSPWNVSGNLSTDISIDGLVNDWKSQPEYWDEGGDSFEGGPTHSNVWTEVKPAATPFMRKQMGMAYDTKRNLVILFGGSECNDAVCGAQTRVADTWAYNITDNTWTELHDGAGGNPSGRAEMGLVYDIANDLIIMYGGTDGAADAETWAYNITDNTWTNMQPSGAPVARYRHSMVYDAKSGKSFIFGGWTGSDRLAHPRVYNFSDNSWSTMSASGPAIRYWQAMSYDYDSDRIVLYGGNNVTGPDMDTWIYNMTDDTWTEMHPQVNPGLLDRGTFDYDPQKRVNTLFGGSRGGATYVDETWMYNFSDDTWSQMNPAASPAGRRLHAMAYDMGNDVMVMYGGVNSSTLNDMDTWIYNFTESDPTRFDIVNYSFANNGSALFARLETNGTLELNNASRFYRLYLGNASDSSRAKALSPYYEERLGFNWTYYAQVNGSTANFNVPECNLFDKDNKDVGDCHFKANTKQLEFFIVMDDIEADGPEKWNMSFETGDIYARWDTAPNNASYIEYNIIPSNYLPTIDDAYVNNTLTHFDEDMNYTVNFTDIEGDSVTFTLNIYHNYTEFDTYHLNDTYTFANWSTNSPPRMNTTWFFNHLPANYSNDTNVTFQIKANDGTDDSAFFNISRYVTNYPPTVDSVQVNATTTYEYMDINVTMNHTDIEAQTVRLFINVYHNFTDDDVYHINNTWSLFNWSKLNPTNATWFYKSGNYSNNVNITFQVRAWDGAQNSSYSNESRYISNYPPLIDSLQVNGSAINWNTWTLHENTTDWKPSGRYMSAIAVDSEDERIVMFAGLNATYNNETWYFNLTDNTWTFIETVSGPLPRAGHAMVYDVYNDKVILFGGSNGTYNDETWAYDLETATWTIKSPATQPSERAWHRMAYDPKSKLTFFFGGFDGAAYQQDTWAYNYTDDSWTNMNPSGDTPKIRYQHGIVYDYGANKTLLFGGENATANNRETYWYNFSDNVWTYMRPSAQPSARIKFGMDYDFLNSKGVLFGGSDGSNDDETWIYNFTDDSWSQMNPGTKPSARYSLSMDYNEPHKRSVLFGGNNGTYINELWSYIYAHWGTYDNEDILVTVNHTDNNSDDTLTEWIKVFHNFTEGDVYHYNDTWSEIKLTQNTTWFYHRDNYSANINITFKVIVGDGSHNSSWQNISRYILPAGAATFYPNATLVKNVRNRSDLGVHVWNVTLNVTNLGSNTVDLKVFDVTPPGMTASSITPAQSASAAAGDRTVYEWDFAAVASEDYRFMHYVLTGAGDYAFMRMMEMGLDPVVVAVPKERPAAKDEDS